MIPSVPIDAMLSIIPDAALVVDHEGVITATNPAVDVLFGYDPGELVGQSVDVLVPEVLRSRHRHQRGGYIEDPRPRSMGSGLDLFGRRRDGTEVAVDISLAPLPVSDRGAVVAAIRDVTDRRHADEVLRRLLVEGERNARWQAVMAEVRLRLLDGDGLSVVLELICDRADELLGGHGSIAVIGRPVRIVAAAGSARRSSEPEMPVLPELDPDERSRLVAVGELEASMQHLFDDPLALLVPIVRDGDVVGALVCGVQEPPDDAVSTIAHGLADLAVLGVELDRLRVDRELLLIGDERERIARELHDLVIQRLFASGLSLQSVLPLVADQRAVDRLGNVVDELDETIREIRTTIFTLAPPPLAAGGLRIEMRGVVAAATRLLGFEPTLRFDGPVDSVVTAVTSPHVVAVVREALTNVARHAHAHHVVVEIVTDGADLRVVVVDDGVGVGEMPNPSGVRNLRARADELGGTFAIGPGKAGGTRLEWRVPVRADD